MPIYKVTKPTFINSAMHGPGTSRPTVSVDKPFKEGEQPSGLELIEKKVAKKPAEKAPAAKAD